MLIGDPDGVKAAKAAGKGLMRETLLRQMREKAVRCQAERDRDVAYGQKLSVLAGIAQKKDAERVKM